MVDFLIEQGIEPETAKRLVKYYELLIAENKAYNLTRITEEREAAIKHFLDSLTAAPLIPQGARVIDVGTGAGIPGIPLLLARPELSMTLLDASEKKMGFVRDTCAALGLNATCLVGRAEELSREPSHRAQYDVVISRAAAPLNQLLELCAGFVKQGGAMLSYLGATAKDLCEKTRSAAKTLGFSPAVLHSFDLFDLNHAIAYYSKIEATPAKYPRRYAQIKSTPL